MGLLARPLTERLAERAERNGILAPDGRYVSVRSPASAFAAYRWTNDYEDKLRRLYVLAHSHRQFVLNTTGRDMPNSEKAQYDMLAFQLIQCRANAMIATADLYDAHGLDIWNDIPSGETRLTGAAIPGMDTRGRVGAYWRTTDDWRAAARAELARVNAVLSKLPPGPGGVIEQDFTPVASATDREPIGKGMGAVPALLAGLPVAWQATIYIVGIVSGAAVLGYLGYYSLRSFFTWLGVISPAYDQALDNAQEAFEQALRDCDKIADPAARAACRMDAAERNNRILEDVQLNMEPEAGAAGFAALATTAVLGIGAIILLSRGD